MIFKRQPQEETYDDKALVFRSPNEIQFSTNKLNKLLYSPLLIPGHTASTRHLPSVYPWISTPSQWADGVLIGIEAYSGTPFRYDPFTMYLNRSITGPNILVAGQIGRGKSTAVKTFLTRSITLLGRQVFLLDPKGEYATFADLIGATYITLEPRGKHQINFLDPGSLANGGDLDLIKSMRSEMLIAMMGALADRPVSKSESALLVAIVNTLPLNANLRDVINLLAKPSQAVIDQMYDESTSVIDIGRQIAYAYSALVSGPLAGMFGEKTTIDVDFVNGNGVIIDLHSIYSDASKLLPIMLGCAAWMSSAITQQTNRKKFLVIDEAWGLFTHVAFGRWIQATMKLARSYGVSVMFVIHRIGDLKSAGAVGSESYQVASSLLSDTETRILFGHDTSDAEDISTILQLTPEETINLTSLPRGTALWKVGTHSAIVHHIVAPQEKELIDTEQRMQ